MKCIHVIYGSAVLLYLLSGLACQPKMAKGKPAAEIPPVIDTVSKEHDTAQSSDGHNPLLWPQVNTAKPNENIEQRIKSILSSMTLNEKVGQMVQVEINHLTPEEMKTYRFGSVLNGGGSWPSGNKYATAKDWVALADTLWNACQDGWNNPIPPMWGTDAVHGHNNVMGATLFPHNIGLGAAHDADLLYRIGQVTAEEVAATGLDWSFAPAVSVVRNDRWGRTFESYAESPELVAHYAEKIITGMQGTFGDANILATAKHFLGDGGTKGGVDHGDTDIPEEALVNIHAPGYFAAIKAGVQVIMASYNSWQGKKMHENAYLLTDILKNRMGFDGFIVSDWNAIEELTGCCRSSCPLAVNAGIDMVMVPYHKDWVVFIDSLKSQAAAGIVPMSRIDDAVSRILRVKLRMGLFDKPAPAKRQLAGKSESIGSAEHREIAREAVRKSLVLLKNNGSILPLDPGKKVVVCGRGADSIPLQTGGWSLTWDGRRNTNKDFKGATSIYAGIKQVVPDAVLDQSGETISKENYAAAIVVIGESPYVEGQGDIRAEFNLEHAKNYPEDIQLLKKIKKEEIPVITVFLSGRPLCVNKELECSNAFVAAWLPGSEGAGIADVLFKKNDGSIRYNFSGTLSFSWPKMPSQATVNSNDTPYTPLFPVGYGLTY